MPRIDDMLPPAERRQVDSVVGLLEDVFSDDLVAAWLYGSAVMGGLRHDSDLDVLAVVDRPTTVDERRAVIAHVLGISGSRALNGPARSIELTIVASSQVRPWRYPPALELQYGDWWRPSFEAGDLEPWESSNPDLAVLLSTVLLGAETLAGQDPAAVLDPVPRDDLVGAMTDGIPGLMAELDTDTRNVLLTLARIWTTLVTGEIVPKDAAADWAISRLPTGHRAVLGRARSIYLGDEPERWDGYRADIESCARAILDGIAGAKPR